MTDPALPSVVDEGLGAPSPCRKEDQPAEVHRQVRWLIGYNIVMVLLGFSFLGLLWYHAETVQDVAPAWLRATLPPLLTSMVGGLLGNVLYNIRVMYVHYVKRCDYDTRWVGKYLSGPWEAAALALVVYALLRGGVATLSGVSLVSEGSNGTAIQDTAMLAALGLGALIGFSIRDVIGWLQRLSETLFGERQEPSGPAR